MTTTLLWFLACGLVLAGAGVVLTRAADAIAERTGLGRVFVGALLLAGATSLPELSTDISAVMLGEPDLAVGDLFGSSVANMLILALLAALSPGRELLRRVSSSHRVTGGLAIALTLAAAALVLARPAFTVLGVNPGSVAICVAFVVGTRATYRRSAAEAAAGVPPGGQAGPAAHDGPSAPVATMQFLAATAVILVVAPVFASVAARLADLSGLGSTFVGTWLLGATTSVPELVSGVTAVRMRAYDLAVANLLGSNSFNMMVFLALDVVHRDGSVFGAVSAAHALTALGAVVLMVLALSAMYRPPRPAARG